MLFGWLRRRDRAPDFVAVIAPYLESLELDASPPSVQRQMERLPEPIGVLIAAWRLTSEVRDGGFAQFFWSPAGVLAPEAHQAFIDIGLPKTANVIASAMRTVGDPYPRIGAARQRIMEGVPEQTEDSLLLRDSLHERTVAFRKTLGSRTLGRFDKAANAYMWRMRRQGSID